MNKTNMATPSKFVATQHMANGGLSQGQYASIRMATSLLAMILF
jgi:hypothetical protein